MREPSRGRTGQVSMPWLGRGVVGPVGDQYHARHRRLAGACPTSGAGGKRQGVVRLALNQHRHGKHTGHQTR